MISNFSYFNAPIDLIVTLDLVKGTQIAREEEIEGGRLTLAVDVGAGGTERGRRHPKKPPESGCPESKTENPILT